jgi:hypothetical protein
VLRVFTSFDQCFVSNGALVSTSRLILALVVLVNSSLFWLSNVFLVGCMFGV